MYVEILQYFVILLLLSLLFNKSIFWNYSKNVFFSHTQLQMWDINSNFKVQYASFYVTVIKR